MTCRDSPSVVIHLTRWLHEIEGDFGESLEESAGYNGSNNQAEEDDEHQEVEHGESDDSALAKSRLLQGVNGRSYLATAKFLV